jgi:fructose-1-phosphate kinase PfkB-like protein
MGKFGVIWIKGEDFDNLETKHYASIETADGSQLFCNGPGDCLCAGFIYALLLSVESSKTSVRTGLFAANDSLYSRSAVPTHFSDEL